MKAKVIILNEQFDGFPKDHNFRLIEEDLRPVEDGEFLAKAKFLSVDPYQRLYVNTEGLTINGEQVAKVIESKNSKYPPGAYVIAEFGWRNYTVSDGSPGDFFDMPPRLLRNYENLPKSLALGVLGMPGNTARFSLMEFCKPNKGETVVVSCAAGCVGLTAGQIAKAQNCTVVGVTSSDIKGTRIVEEFGFDAYVNYRDPNFAKNFEEATPNGIDCYLDLAGGKVANLVINRINTNGRVCLVGAISTYNEKQPTARRGYSALQLKNVKLQDFNVFTYKNLWEQGIADNRKMIENEQMKYFETITEGFENMPQAFMGLFRSENFGKAIVKV